MSIDRTALNQERARIGKLLAASRADIERPFTQVICPDKNELLSFGSIGVVKKAQSGEIARFSFHHETTGHGDTAQAAFDDWKSKLRLPYDEVLYWRTEPEIEYSIDFPSASVKWRVYSRYAVLKPER